MTTINTDEWRAELDRVLGSALNDSHRNIVEYRGFTIKEFMEHQNLKRTKAFTFVCELERQGIVRQIGCRPGRGGQKVYEIVKEKK